MSKYGQYIAEDMADNPSAYPDDNEPDWGEA